MLHMHIGRLSAIAGLTIESEKHTYHACLVVSQVECFQLLRVSLYPYILALGQ